MKNLILVSMFLIFAMFNSPHLMSQEKVEKPIFWITHSFNLDEEVLVFFNADWCPPCQKMKKEILIDKRIQNHIKNKYDKKYFLIKTDDEKFKKTVEKACIKTIPTLVRYAVNENGLLVEVSRLEGFNTIEKVREFLGKNFFKLKQSLVIPIEDIPPTPKNFLKIEKFQRFWLTFPRKLVY